MHKNRNSRPGAKPDAKLVSRAASGHQVRIIGGQWKRTPLTVPDVQGLRPTPDRVRETVFNWLTHLLDGRWESVVCLDLFAGTGALGFEAASRGAGRVTMVESSPAAFRQLEATKEKLHAGQVSLLRGDALSIARRLADNTTVQGNRFNLIFLDPPYRQEWLEKILPLCHRLLEDGGLVYAESEETFIRDSQPDWLAGWDIARAGQAGMVFHHLLRRNNSSEI